MLCLQNATPNVTKVSLVSSQLPLL